MVPDAVVLLNGLVTEIRYRSVAGRAPLGPGEMKYFEEVQGRTAGLPRGVGGAYGYDAAPDGQRFLVSLAPNGVEAGPVVPVTVITNWTSLLKEQKK